MYQGEVDVAEEDLTSFLEVAEDLLIKGLSEGNKKGSNSIQEPLEIKHQNTNHIPKRKRNVDNDSPLNTKSIEALNDLLQTFDNFIDNDNTISASPNPKESKVPKTEKTDRNAQSLVLMTQGNQFICGKCNKQFTRKDVLEQHSASIHEGVRYSCYQCDYKATQKSNLRRHISRNHQTVQE